ncbi:MAG: hypothetical protein ABT940_10480 [Alphaproteobacteria bacterium]
MGSIVDMMLSVFMSKKAARNLKALAKASSGAGEKSGRGAVTSGKESGSEREKAIRDMQAGAQHMMTPERAELIRHAMEIRRAKQAIFVDLNDEQKQRLVALALKKLMHETPKKEG